MYCSIILVKSFNNALKMKPPIQDLALNLPDFYIFILGKFAPI